MKHIIFGFIALFLAQVLWAQQTFEFNETDRTNRIKEDITVLAHDSLRGREGGSEWEFRAGNYIIKEYEEIGLDLGFRNVESSALVRSSYKAQIHFS